MLPPTRVLQRVVLSQGMTRCISCSQVPRGIQSPYLLGTRNYCQKNESGSVQDKKSDESPDDKQKAATEKLTNLLSSMKVAATASEKPPLSLNLARPQNRLRKQREPAVKDDVQSTPAVKDDVQNMPAEKVLEEKESEAVDPKLVQAVKDVAGSLGGDPQKTESELLQRLRASAQETSVAKSSRGDRSSTNLNELFADMKIDRGEKKQTAGAGYQMQEAPQFQEKGVPPKPRSWAPSTRTSHLHDMQIRMDPKIGIFSGSPLSIFVSEKVSEGEAEVAAETKTWNLLESREIKLMGVQPPTNAFEEMIQWTEKGWLWTFPIDNEIGLEEETKVPFHEHIFLDHLLEGFPETGPIRHFMELVVTGLSMNPYLTVQRKHEHVEWFRQYFKEKEEILKVSGIALQ